MSNIDYWLNRKYANMEQQTASQGAEQAARAGLLGAQAGAVPVDAASMAGLRRAQAGVYGQEEEGKRLSNLPGQLMETEALPGARSYMQDLNKTNPMAGFGLMTGDVNFADRVKGLRGKLSAPVLERPEERRIDVMRGMGTTSQRFNKGTPEVMKKGKTKVVDETGNGQPDVDTVPAMLAEGEAVLNVGAAERMGRDEIKALNKQGLRDMNMDDKARPVIKKGGRLGAYKGVEMAYAKGTACAGMKGYAKGTNFARTSPENDAEYHPTEYSEPRDPEHDAEHMAQPLSGGGQGFSLRTGTAKVMKMPMKMQGYAEGTADAGGHGTPDSAEAVNMAGTVRRTGMRGYAAGVANVPGETETELANFDKQRDRNQLNEAMPYGVPALGEPAGEAGAVTPSREVARMRQNYGLTAQGFAMGTEDVQAKQPAQIPGVVYAAEGDENILSRAKDLGSRAMSGLRGMVGRGPVDLGTVGTPPAAAPAAAPAPAPTPAAAPAPAPAPTSAAATGVAAKQAAAVQAARTAMGETAAQAASGLRGGAGAAPAVAPAIAAAPATAAAPAGSAAYQAGQAVGKATSGLRGLGAVPVIGSLASGAQAFSEMPGEFFNDPNVPVMDKAGQAARSLGRAALPYAGGLAGSFVTPVVGTATGAGLGMAAASQIEPEGEALKKWRASQPQMAAAVPAATPAAVAPAAAAPAPAAAKAAGGGVGGGVGGGSSQAGLRGLATMGSIMGNTGSQAVMRDLTERDAEAGRNARSAADRAASAALKAAGGKTGVQDMKFFDQPTVDAKTGRVVPGQERPDLKEAFDGQYLPQYAARLGKRPNQLEPTEQAKALISFDLNRAAQNYALKSGKGFNFQMPVNVDKIEYMDDLPMFRRLLGRERGETTWKEGIWDKGGIVITDGREKQVLPIEFLDESGSLNDPAISQLVKSLKARGEKK